MADPVCVSCLFCWAVCTFNGISENVESMKSDLRVLVKDMRPPLAQGMDTALQQVTVVPSEDDTAPPPQRTEPEKPHSS